MSDTNETAKTRDPHAPRGHTRSTVEDLKDAQLTAKLNRTEAKFGIQTGVRFKEDGQYVVSVSFYPEPVFYIQKMNTDYTLQEPEVLAKEEFDQTWGLRL